MKTVTRLIQAAALFAVAGFTMTARSEQYALMVAIEDYSKVGARSLPGCLTDLKDLENVLESKFGFPSANITVLGDDQATKAKVLAALDDLADKAQPGDSVVIYYSGHGGQVPDMNDDDETSDSLDEALITYDFNPKDPDTWLLDDHLRAALSRLKTRRTLVLIDACHSGTGTRGGIINKKAEFGFESMLGRGRVDKQQMETTSKADGPSSHVLIAACAANELSAMGQYDGVPRSLFTTALVRVLPRMTTASLGDLNAAVFAEMERIDSIASARQHPQLETSINVNVSVLIGPGGGGDAFLNDENDEPPIQRPTDGLPSAFPVTVTTDKREYVAGEKMVATVVSKKAGFLRLYFVDKTGSASLIFPNHYQRDNRIAAGKRIEVGGSGAPFAFRTAVPGGTEILLAAVSPDPFSDDDAFDFSKEKPFVEIGKVTSLRKLVDRGTKDIVIEGRDDNGPVRPVQIGRAGCIYEIVEP